jgi:predicted ATPase
MKIKKIKFIKYKLFEDHEVIFGDKTIPQISFLVGNNGAGKTHVLEAINDLLTTRINDARGEFEVDFELELNDEDKKELNTNSTHLELKIEKNRSSNIPTRKILNEPLIKFLPPLRKIIYSPVEVEFKEKNINSITAEDIDSKNSFSSNKLVSKTISEYIPQLLININNLDHQDEANWHRNNPKKDIPPEIGGRLRRFINVYHKFFNGSKKFEKIETIGNVHKIKFLDDLRKEIELKQLSSGEKQIIYRVGFLLQDLGNIKGGIILIDEPETSLHPILQNKFKNILLEAFDGLGVQIIIATHSPYIFENLKEDTETCIKVDRSKKVSKKISLTFPEAAFIPSTTSVNLISYLAYDIPSEMLHIELYTILYIREGIKTIKAMGNRFIQLKVTEMKTFKRDLEPKGEIVKEALPQFIRNKIHHGEETGREKYTKEELKRSIDIMIGLLSKK